MALLLVFAVLLGAPLALFGAGTAGSGSSEGETPLVTPSTPLAPATPGKSRRATLALKSLRPLVVVGTGFKPGESVRISGATTTRTMSAGRAGSFTARFRGVDPCGSLTVTAVGSMGSRASFNFSSLTCHE